MKKILITIMALFTLNVYSQINDIQKYPIINKTDSMVYMKSRSAGDELQKASMHFYEGLIISGAGALIYNIKVDNNDHSSKQLMQGLGIGFSLAGIGLIIESHFHIKKAGIILNQNGIGLKIRLD